MANSIKKEIIVYGYKCLKCGGYAFYYDHMPTERESIRLSNVIKTKEYNPTEKDIMVCQSCNIAIDILNLNMKYLDKIKITIET